MNRRCQDKFCQIDSQVINELDRLAIPFDLEDSSIFYSLNGPIEVY